MICGEVAVTDRLSAPTGHEGTWLKKHKIKAFHQIVQSKYFCFINENKIGISLNIYDTNGTNKQDTIGIN